MEMPNFQTMLRRFGDRITATQTTAADDLALQPAELAQYQDWATGRAPPHPIDDPFRNVVKPQRPGAMGPPSSNADMLQESAWYGGKALFSVLTNRGMDVSLDDCLAVATLSQFRPFGLILNFVTTLYDRPRSIGISQLQEFEKAISGTEQWLGLLHESKVFQAIIEQPLSEQDFARALRTAGANNDPHLAPLVVQMGRYGSLPLVPGASVAFGLREISDFYLDAPPGPDGAPRCQGMRDFAAVMRQLLVKNNPAVKEGVGHAIEREISAILDPIARITARSQDAAFRATGHLMFLRDGLLRLCNRHLAQLYASAVEVPSSSDIAKILETMAPSQAEREHVIMSRAFDLAVLNESKTACRVLSDLLPKVPPADRAALVDHFVTAPGLIECVEVLAAGGNHQGLLRALPFLVTPLPFAKHGHSLAQLIVEMHRDVSPGIARSLYEHRDFLASQLCQPDNHRTGALLLALLDYEGRRGAKVSQVTSMITEVKDAVVTRSSPLAALSSLEQRAVAVGFQLATSELAPSTPPARHTLSDEPKPSDEHLRLQSTWAAWALPFLRTHESQTAFLRQFDAHGATDWFRKLLLTPSLRSPYLDALNAGDGSAQEQCLDAARATGTKTSQPPAISINQGHGLISQYAKIVFIGGLQDGRREGDIKELLPPECDVRFYYADAGANSFRNLSPAALAGEGATLVVYRPNFTGHSMYYRAVDAAESAGSTFIVLPKGAQNPNVIIERMSEALRGRGNADKHG